MLFYNYGFAQTSKPTVFKNGIQGNSNIFDSDGNNLGNLSSLISTANNVIQKSQIGAANGVAPLDANSTMSGDINLGTSNLANIPCIYETISYSIKNGGSNYTIGDKIADQGDGALYSVSSVDSNGAILALNVVWNGYSTSDLTNQTFDLINEDIQNNVANGASITILTTQQTSINPTKRLQNSILAQEYNPLNYGVLLDGSSEDLDIFAKFYAILPDKSVIKFPCGSKLPPFPTHNMHTGPIGQVNGAVKQITWDATFN